MAIIQLQAVTENSIKSVIEPVRKAVSSVCAGIDDMSLLGTKALVVRSEIIPSKLDKLIAVLSLVGVECEMPKSQLLDAISDNEQMLTIQVVSKHKDTDGRISIPKVPG